MAYCVQQATMKDLDRILEIYAFARKFMAETGNPNQWGTTHPPKDQLVEDIRQGNLYVVSNDGQLCGVFAFFLGEDPTYREIFEGAWLSDEAYGTIHRIASDGSHGIFPAALDWCKQQIAHIRIDTHHDNVVMQHVVQKAGFQRCGIIYIADGTPRIAYELL